MRELLEKFDFDNTISKLDEVGLLFQVVQRFGDPKVDLHPDAVDNAAMGTIFEELIRKFNEALNENPGEHFTPRDVVHLMVDLLLAGGRRRLRTKGVVLSVYDPCCGSGGMLTIAKEHVTAGERRGGEACAPAVNPGADIHLFGQEVNPETFAICKSDLFMKSEDGRDAENVVFGSTLSNDRHAGAGFDYMIANPPYGKDWKRDQDAVRGEHDRGGAGRFGPGLPRISDGQLLVPAAHAGARPESGRGRLAGRHRHERHLDDRPHGRLPGPGPGLDLRRTCGAAWSDSASSRRSRGTSAASTTCGVASRTSTRGGGSPRDAGPASPRPGFVAATLVCGLLTRWSGRVLIDDSALNDCPPSCFSEGDVSRQRGVRRVSRRVFATTTPCETRPRRSTRHRPALARRRESRGLRGCGRGHPGHARPHHRADIDGRLRGNAAALARSSRTGSPTSATSTEINGLHGGRIVQRGTHHTLMEGAGLHRALLTGADSHGRGSHPRA